MTDAVFWLVGRGDWQAPFGEEGIFFEKIGEKEFGSDVRTDW
jgi:hypothetical protein